MRVSGCSGVVLSKLSVEFLVIKRTIDITGQRGNKNCGIISQYLIVKIRSSIQSTALKKRSPLPLTDNSQNTFVFNERHGDGRT
jgi:hypothetical protein